MQVQDVATRGTECEGTQHEDTAYPAQAQAARATVVLTDGRPSLSNYRAGMTEDTGSSARGASNTLDT